MRSVAVGLGLAHALWATGSPWPFETVPRIHEALRVQEGFGDLVSRSGELSDAELQAEFRALMAGGK